MADEKEKKLALKVYNALIEAMKIQKWTYDADEKDLFIRFDVKGEDIPMEFIVYIDADRQIIRLASKLPFKFDKSCIIDGAVATCLANYSLEDGSFDFDLETGEVIYRMTSSFRCSMIGAGLLLYMINYACQAVDEYNDKLYLVSIGKLKAEDILED